MIALACSKTVMFITTGWNFLSFPLKFESPDGDMRSLQISLLFPYELYGGERRYGLVTYNTGAIAQSRAGNW